MCIGVIDEGEAVIVKRLGAETIVQDVEARAAETVPSNSSKAGVSLEFRVRVAVLTRIRF